MLISDPDHGSEISMMLCERRGAGAGSLYLPFCIFSWGRSIQYCQEGHRSAYDDRGFYGRSRNYFL